MKKLIIPLLLILVMACERKPVDSDFEYDYRIACGMHIDNAFLDSLVYYYNSEKRLLKVDRFYSPVHYNEHFVTYYPDSVNAMDGTYHFNQDHQVTHSTYYGNREDFTYENDLVTYKKCSYNNVITREEYLFYENSNMTKDSIIHHNQQDGKKYITVYNYTYSETPVPGFMVDYSGLFEFPLRYSHLMEIAEAGEYDLLYEYTYDMTDTSLIVYSQFINNNEYREVITTSFTLLE